MAIIFVFDPLAIALVVAANFAFDNARPKTRKIFIWRRRGRWSFTLKNSKKYQWIFSTRSSILKMTKIEWITMMKFNPYEEEWDEEL